MELLYPAGLMKLHVLTKVQPINYSYRLIMLSLSMVYMYISLDKMYVYYQPTEHFFLRFGRILHIL